LLYQGTLPNKEPPVRERDRWSPLSDIDR